MASFDWMFNPGFRDRVAEQVVRTIASEGLSSYDEAIVNEFMRYLAATRVERSRIEEARPVREQRGQADALGSVEFLVREAARLARADGRKDLRVRDIQDAYRANFCKIWPFC